MRSRFDKAVALNSQLVETTKMAESRILDIDVAEEASELSLAEIRRQAAISVLAHANTRPETALMLLSY